MCPKVVNQVLSTREVILELSDPRTEEQPECVSVVVTLEAAPGFYQPWFLEESSLLSFQRSASVAFSFDFVSYLKLLQQILSPFLFFV